MLIRDSQNICVSEQLKLLLDRCVAALKLLLLKMYFHYVGGTKGWVGIFLMYSLL